MRGSTSSATWRASVTHAALVGAERRVQNASLSFKGHEMRKAPIGFCKSGPNRSLVPAAEKASCPVDLEGRFKILTNGRQLPVPECPHHSEVARHFE